MIRNKPNGILETMPLAKLFYLHRVNNGALQVARILEDKKLEERREAFWYISINTLCRRLKQVDAEIANLLHDMDEMYQSGYEAGVADGYDDCLADKAVE